MHIKVLVVIGLFVVALSACQKNAWQNYQPADYDGEFISKEVTDKAEWERRWDLEAAVFEDHIWIFGGYNPGLHGEDSYLEDVWKSANGKDWELVTKSAPWKGRRGHRVEVFNDGAGDAIYLIGGFSVDEATGYRQYCNDVWKSTDGENWLEIKSQSTPYFNSETDWYPRFEHTLVSGEAEGRPCMYLIGGASLIVGKSAKYAMKYFNDVWRSFDGASWERLPNNDFGIRSEHAAAYNPNTGEIYIQGGWHGAHYDNDTVVGEPVKHFRYLWKSTDGISWVRDSVNSDFSTGYFSRGNHEMVFYNNALYGLSGKSPSSISFTSSGYSSIWKRIDEKQYMLDSQGLPYFARFGYASVVWNNKIWLLGGYTTDEGQCNEVWTLEFEN